MNRIKLFTHTDLDGIGSAILLKLISADADIEFSEHTTVNDQVHRFINKLEYLNYAKVIMTDISINDEMAYKIDLCMKEKFILLDHHKTAEGLNKYSWANIVIKSSIGMECGTNLLKDYLKSEGFYNGQYDDFIEKIRRYDTWEWKNRFNDREPKQLNDLLSIYGRDEFMNNMMRYLKITPIIEFNEYDRFLLRMREEQYRRYVEKKQNSLILRKLGQYTAGIVFAEQYISELGNELAERNTHCDFILMVNLDRGIEYRSIKDDIDLGQIARSFGGGGHPKAAGSPITDNIRKLVIDLILKEK